MSTSLKQHHVLCRDHSATVFRSGVHQIDQLRLLLNVLMKPCDHLFKRGEVSAAEFLFGLDSSSKQEKKDECFHAR